MLGRQLGAPVAVALLDPQGVDRLVAAGGDVERSPCYPQRVPQVQAILGGRVHLPAQLANIGDAQRQHRRAANRDLPGAQVGRGRVRYVVVGRQPQDVAGVRPPQPHHGAA